MGRLMSRLLANIEQLPGPTVAALNGPAIGGGTELALAFDMRVAADTTYLRFAQTRMGITTGWQGIERLCRIVGYSRCLHLMLSGRTVGAEEARGLGLVDEVWPADSFDRELDAFLCDLAEAGDAGLAVKHILRATSRALELSSGELELRLLRELWDRPTRRLAMQNSLRK